MSRLKLVINRIAASSGVGPIRTSPIKGSGLDFKPTPRGVSLHKGGQKVWINSKRASDITVESLRKKGQAVERSPESSVIFESIARYISNLGDLIKVYTENSKPAMALRPHSVTPSGLRAFFIPNLKRLLVGGYCRGLFSQGFVDFWFKAIPSLRGA